jgi:hypothetical protein
MKEIRREYNVADVVEAIEGILTEDHLCWGHECGGSMTAGKHVAMHTKDQSQLAKHLLSKDHGYSKKDVANMNYQGGPAYAHRQSHESSALSAAG